MRLQSGVFSLLDIPGFEAIVLLDGYWTIKHALHLKNTGNEVKGSPKEKARTMQMKESRNMLIFREMSKGNEVVHLV